MTAWLHTCTINDLAGTTDRGTAGFGSTGKD